MRPSSVKRKVFNVNKGGKKNTKRKVEKNFHEFKFETEPGEFIVDFFCQRERISSIEGLVILARMNFKELRGVRILYVCVAQLFR